MHNKVVGVKPQSITRKKDTRNAVSLDSENNNVQVRDIVNVIEGPHSAILVLLRMLQKARLELSYIRAAKLYLWTEAACLLE
ncbi:transcription elongation factor SPT5, partial [Elysia marginata]